MNIPSTARNAILFGAASLALIASAPAEAFLDLRFDDPEKLLAGMEKSASLTPGLSKPKATVASGIGGRSTLMILTKAPKSAVDAQGFTTISEPAPGLKIRFDSTSECSELGISVIPDDAEKMVSVKGSHYAFQGGLDFFLRVTSDGAVPKLGFWGWVGPLALFMNIPKPEDGVSAKVFTREPVLQTSEQTKPSLAVLSKLDAPLPFELGDIMHVALVFETDDEGMTTIKIHLQKGTGPLEVNSSTLNAVVGPFLVPASAGTEAKPRFSLRLSREEASQSMDVFRFRVFSQAPAAFPGLK